MGTIELFDHTADVGLIARASDLDDLFATAACGMFDYVVVNREDVREAELETVEVSAQSLDELLAEWLNELIFRAETRHRLYRSFEVTVDEAALCLTATIKGEAIDRERHELDHEVKAVTRHGLLLVHEPGGWRAEFILDI